MQMRDGLTWLLFSAGTLGLAGCGGSTQRVSPAQQLRSADAGTAEIVRAARVVLSRMHFAIEKADPDSGIVRTGPLAGAQFFELWRSDNTTLGDAIESNIHSIRRSVELSVRQDDDAPVVHCIVRVQRLSLPGEEVASVSQAYRIHSRSDPDLQRLLLTPQQRARMAWIDLDNDDALAAEILRRVDNQLTQHREEEAS